MDPAAISPAETSASQLQFCHVELTLVHGISLVFHNTKTHSLPLVSHH